MFRQLLLATAGVCAIAGGAAAQDQTLLLRQPAVSGDTLVFTYGGDLWTSRLSGAAPRRLTTHDGDEHDPQISPDGAQVAFTADHQGNTDVYVLPLSGGQPERLTFHPGEDEVLGWTPDGRILFSSRRETNHGRSGQLWSIAPGEGYPVKEMEARVYRGDMAADGTLAYLPNRVAYNALYGGRAGWRLYRGGASGTIAILDSDRTEVEWIESDRLNDINPIWAGDTLYLLSDRDGESLALYRYDRADGEMTQVHSEAPWDIRWADTDGATIVFEAGGQLKRFDIATGSVSQIPISIEPDSPQLAERWVDASSTVTHAAISPTGQRALLTARGEVFTVPLDEGSTRNLTTTDGVREYTALWSPEGEEIAYISDEGGVQSLRIVDQRGFDEPRELELGGDEEAFYFLEHWAPGGRHLVYTDNHLNLWTADLETGRSTRVATMARRDQVELDVSPDGRWLAYTLEQPNFLRDLVLYDLETGRSTTVSDGMADTASPAFSRDGAYLYFAASTNVGPVQVGLNMNSREKPNRYGLYALVLSADGTSPVLPGAGDETGGEQDDEASDGDGDVTVRVDLDGLFERKVALPVSENAYDSLAAGEDGALYYIERAQPGAENTPPGGDPQSRNRLMRFDFEEREADEIAEGVTGLVLAADGEHALVDYAEGPWRHGALGESLDLEPLDTSGLRLRIDPQAEWRQIFDEVWRMERAYFYDADLQGLDWDGVRERYEPLLDHVARREDLNGLLAEMIGEMQAGHNNVGGGDGHSEPGVPTGLLGADLSMASNRYRIDRIYSGESWTPFAAGPLAQPGLDVDEGDFILAIDGRELTAADNLFVHLQNKAGDQVTLTVADDARGTGRRDVVVEPVSNEGALRQWGWIEENRRQVDAATGGRVGYVYLPNTAGAGYDFFNRMYYAQANRDALIFDERSNSGGQAADYITDVLSPFHLSGWRDRDGMAYNTPNQAHYGPKAMLIDQDAGSGGDYLPYAFRRREIGPLIGTRTWGGLIGISANPPLIDGGSLSVPYFRFYTPEGAWTVENEGVAPDIEVLLDPVAYNAGRDTQLEAAIERLEAMMAESGRAAVPLTMPEPPEAPGL